MNTLPAKMTPEKSNCPSCLLDRAGVLKLNEPMSQHTTWRVGGLADYFYTPADHADLSLLIRDLPKDIPVLFVGLGSNLLVRDGGIRGLVVCTPKGLDDIQCLDTQTLYAQSGVPSAKVARQSVKNDMSGAEFLAGIPGSFGGALAMNAGAFGGETWDIVSRVECLDKSGTTIWRDKREFSIAYRHASLDGVPASELFFIGAEIKLAMADETEAQTEIELGRNRIRALLQQRVESQPIQTANAGSVFKNPPEDHAARLLQACGLKGNKQGGAEFSSKHANFIVNLGNATAADIEHLIQLGQEQVKAQFGVELQAEVRIVGEAR